MRGGPFHVMKKLLIAFGLLFLAADSPQATVKYRQTSMKAMGAHMSAISLVVKHQIASRADLAVHAEAILGVRRSVGEWVAAGTGPAKWTSGVNAEPWRRIPASKR